MKINKKVKIALRSLLMKCGAIATDKATLLFEGAELEVGTEVFVEDENGEIMPAEDGEYVAEGVTYVVAEGKVAEIRKEEENTEPEAEAEPETEVEAEEEPQAEPADEPEAAEEESIEDKVARLEASIGEIREGIESILEAVAALASRVEVVEEKLKSVEEPAADPAEDQEEVQETNSRLSYLKNRKK